MKRRTHEGEFERFTHAGRTVVLCYDPDAPSPRDNDGNLVRVAHWHRRMDIFGEKDGIRIHPEDGDALDTREGFIAYIEERTGSKVLALLPLWIYSHSGTKLVAADGNPFTCPWDSGQCGWAYVLDETARNVGCTPGETYAVTRQKVGPDGKLTAEREPTGETVTYDEAFFVEAIRSEVAIYDRWASGHFVGYIVEDKDGDQIDSCWGIDDPDYAREEAKSAAEHVRGPGEVDAPATATCNDVTVH